MKDFAQCCGSQSGYVLLDISDCNVGFITTSLYSYIERLRPLNTQAFIETAVSDTDNFTSSTCYYNIMYECCPRSTQKKLDSYRDEFRETYLYSAPCSGACCLSVFFGEGVGLTMCQQCI